MVPCAATLQWNSSSVTIGAGTTAAGGDKIVVIIFLLVIFARTFFTDPHFLHGDAAYANVGIL